MPPRGVKSAKRKRQYEHIKQSEKKRGGRSAARAEEIAARTVNKERREAGQTKNSRSKKKSASKKKSSSSSRKSSSRKKSTSRKKSSSRSRSR
jgi:hypothetical protein